MFSIYDKNHASRIGFSSHLPDP